MRIPRRKSKPPNPIREEPRQKGKYFFSPVFSSSTSSVRVGVESAKSSPASVSAVEIARGLGVTKTVGVTEAVAVSIGVGLAVA